ncbi:MAG: ACT domain-containing protein, partial [Actinomycetota bacterium]|nr:ACT domain-containing protein [Actinomycetota bacterium]
PYAVAGTTIGHDQRPQLVRALGYEIDVELDRLMLFAVNDDTPGMIGRLGTLLGEDGVNIANMAVSRNRQAARALMALSLDSEPPEGLLARLRAEPGFVDARFIVLPEL